MVSVEGFIVVAKQIAVNNKIQCLNLSAPAILELFNYNLTITLEYVNFLFWMPLH